MSTQLAVANTGLPSTGEWNTMLQMADTLIQSGLAPEAVRTPAAALVIMQKGRELGIPPLYALSSIAVIKGKPVAGAELLLAVIYRDHGDDAVKIVQTDATICHLKYKRRAWTAYEEFSFTMADAKQAGITNNPTWTKYPQAMLRARCISAVARMAFPDSIGGMYTPEELGATVTVNDEGAVEFAAPAAPEPLMADDNDNTRAFTPIDVDFTASTVEYLRETLAWIKANEPDNPALRPVVEELRKRAEELRAAKDAAPQLADIPGVTKGVPAQPAKATANQRERYEITCNAAKDHGIQPYVWPPGITEEEAEKSIAELEKEIGYAEIEGDPVAEVVTEGEVVEAAA